jgi:hypothetical protein
MFSLNRNTPLRFNAYNIPKGFTSIVAPPFYLQKAAKMRLAAAAKKASDLLWQWHIDNPLEPLNPNEVLDTLQAVDEALEEVNQ